ncbi:MAG: putative colanic acid biosynthesis acetyltransferase [Tetrasphaera sp.]|jgi:putative colanic acid biosynthesis acetyltransferase WcaF|nr:putative colanic acid biosynthesis acetyltransferase [Tetrasphaera sp.]
MEGVHTGLVRTLSGFTGTGYDKGRSVLWQAAWMLTSGAVFQRWWCPASLRVTLLRAFGAQVGTGVLVRHRVRIHWPWKLHLDDNVWIGEGAWILNLEPVTIGHDTCLSQEVFLCTGSHRFDSPTFEFDNAAITIGARTWVAARATILRGVAVGDDALVGACALVIGDVPDGGRVLAPVASSISNFPN